MEIVNKIRNKSGAYFRSIAPDVYAVIANLVFSKKMIHIHHPLSLNGRSSASIGWSTLQQGGDGRRSEEAVKKLVEEYGTNVEKTIVDMRIRLATAYVMDALILVKKHLLDENFDIEYAAWINRLVREINQLPAPIANRDIVYVRSMAQTLGVHILDEPASHLNKAKSESSPVLRNMERLLNPALRQISDRNLPTVSDASRFLSYLAGVPPRVRHTNVLATADSIRRWIFVQLNLSASHRDLANSL
jgi:hypothetical protein